MVIEIQAVQHGPEIIGQFRVDITNFGNQPFLQFIHLVQVILIQAPLH